MNGADYDCAEKYEDQTDGDQFYFAQHRPTSCLSDFYIALKAKRPEAPKRMCECERFLFCVAQNAQKPCAMAGRF